MKKTIKLFGFVAILATLFLASCNKTENTPAPVANFTISPNDTILGSQTVTFTNTSTNADTYSWNFGDGTTSTAVSPSKTEFNVTGETPCYVTFNVTLTATKNGKSSTVTKPLVVEYCN